MTESPEAALETTNQGLQLQTNFVPFWQILNYVNHPCRETTVSLDVSLRVHVQHDRLLCGVSGVAVAGELHTKKGT